MAGISRGKERNLFSTLDQINRANVSRLEVAWTYETGDADEYQANNLIIDGLLSTPTQSRRVVALNAVTGEELRKWDPVNENTGRGRASQRGLVYWANENGDEQRLFTAVDGLLFASNPRTGKTIRSFGENGAINLGSGRNTPGIAYKDVLNVGGLGGKGGRPRGGTLVAFALRD